MTQWEQMQNIPGGYELEYITDDSGEFTIILSSVSKLRQRLYLSFICPAAYQVTSKESHYNDQLLILKSINSPFMSWLAEQGGGVFNNDNKQIHFSVVAVDCVIDIVDFDGPRICFVEG